MNPYLKIRKAFFFIVKNCVFYYKKKETSDF